MNQIITDKSTYAAYIKAGLWIVIEAPKFHTQGKSIAVVDARMKGKYFKEFQVIINGIFTKGEIPLSPKF